MGNAVFLHIPPTFMYIIRMRLPLKTAILLACALLMLAVRPQPSEAHANLLRSQPAANSTLDAPPDRVVIWFTETLEPAYSHIQVLDSAGMRVDDGESVVDANDTTVMSVGLPPLPNGTYTAAWRSVSTIDGHALRGAFVFSVGEPISAADIAAAQAVEPPLLQSPEEPAIRWAMLLSALALTGGLAFELLVSGSVFAAAGTRSPLGRLRPRLRARSQRLLWLSVAGLLASCAAMLVSQTALLFETSIADAIQADAIGAMLATEWGRIWLWRFGLTLLVGALFAVPMIIRFRRRPRQERLHETMRWLALLASLGILLTISMTSHAAATLGIARFALANDALHLAASAVWVGGLLHLIAGAPLFIGGISESARRHALHRIVRRFSAAAALSVIALAITGAYGAWAQVTEFAAIATPYGFTLIAKILLIGALLPVAAVNLIWIRPRLRGSSTAALWLRRTVLAEVILAALVILAVGFLTALEPARQTASRLLASQQQNLTFTDTVEGTDITLAVEPARVGANTFTVSIADRLGEPIDYATDVRVRASYLDADFGEEPVSAENIGGGAYRIADSLISIAGAYQAEILVQRPDAFDARAAFRFEIAGADGVAGGSGAIAPNPANGGLYLGGALGLLGFVFLVGSMSMGGWYNRAGALTMACGAAAFIAGAWLLIDAQGAPAPQQIVRNPIPPTSDSIAAGKTLYERHCQTCHGDDGLGDGPGGVGLEPPPANLAEHVPLHGDADIFDFIGSGIEGTAMVGLSDRLTDDEIWHIINFIRTQADEQNAG